MKEDNSSGRDKKVKRTKSQADVLSSSSSANGSVPGSGSSLTDSFRLEEEAAQRRTAQEDFQHFKTTCSKIRDHMKIILNLPNNKKNEVEVAESQLQACLLFLELKQLNRLDKHRSKQIRDGVNEAKQKVDNFHLQLQNMLYEVMHLEKEVTKCLQFRSKDEEIELVAPEEFYKEAPASISRPSETKNDKHQQTLSRLEWELEQRKRLAEKLRETENAKQMYLQEIDKKRDCLDNLQPNLRSIMEATQPLHQELGMPLQASQLKHKSAEFLPRPLYVLYVQANAYRESCDKKGMFVDVEGNPEEAKLLQSQAEDIDEESDSDQEEASKKRHRRSLSDKKESSKKVLATHPLSVNIQIKDKAYSMTISFRYLIHLHIITATVTNTQFQSHGGISAGQILQPDSLLNCLFPKDDGKESPNPANNFELRRAGIDSFEDCIREVGFAYLWAQHLAGLDFLPLEQNQSQPTIGSANLSSKKQHSLSASRVEVTMIAIRERMVSRLALHQQLLAFEQLIINIPSEATSHFPSKVSARFKDWKQVTWNEAQAHPASKQPVEMGVIHDGMTVYSALFERGSAKLRALVLVGIDYPKAPPFLLLTLAWKVTRNSSTDASIWELEQLVNVLCPEKYMTEANQKLHILSLQLRQLLVAFDVYLETDSASSEPVEGPKEFPASWAYARITKGPNRSRPYNYIKQLDIFT